MTLSIASASAASVPGLIGIQSIGKRYIRLHGGLDRYDFRAAVFGIQDLFQIASRASGIDRLLAPDQDELAVGDIRNRGSTQRIGEGKSLLHCADAAVAIVRAAVSH